MRNNISSTAAYDDPDPEGTDAWGILPLFHVIEDGEDEESEDESKKPATLLGAEDEGDEEAEIEPEAREILVSEDDEDEDDDDDAYEALRSGTSDLSPGEAEAYVDYMRPLSVEEEELTEDPMFRNLRWVDDPAHVDDLLKAGKGKKGLDKLLQDRSYGDDMGMTTEEMADRFDTDANLNAIDADDEIRLIQEDARRRAQHRRLLERACKNEVVRGLNKILVAEHANFLADDDARSGKMRPRSYYDNIARLWARNELVSADLPTSTEDVHYGDSLDSFARKTNEVLDSTSGARSSSCASMGDEYDTSGWGWNPLKAIKSAVKKVGKTAYGTVKYGVKTGKRGLKYGERGVKTGLKYGKKGVKAVGKLAQAIALKPIRAVIRKFTGKIVGRRASYLAKQRGLKAPGPTEKAEALTWSKQFVQKNEPKYGGAISSLMGAEYGITPVDISFGDDEIGLGAGTLAALIILGPFTLLAILTGILQKAMSGGAPAQPSEPSGEDAAAAADEGAPDEGEPPAGDEEAYPEEAADYSEGQLSKAFLPPKKYDRRGRRFFSRHL